MIQEYKTVERTCGPFEYKEKGSNFLAFAFPVKSQEEADEALRHLRKKHHDARHIPFAFRLGEGEEKLARSSDDGEPSGTGGLPILQEIERMALFNVLLAVVRYFGGTKLGTGNLRRAFSSAARGLLESASITTVRLKKELEFFTPYELTGEVMGLLSLHGGSLLAQEYEPEGVRLKLALPVEKHDSFCAALREKTRGHL